MTGLSIDDQRRAAGLTGPMPPPLTEVVEEETPKCQHGCATMPCRHTRTEEKHKQHPASALRGVPILGRGVGGAVDGTRPGDSARALMDEIDALYEQARIKRAKVERTRRKDHGGDRIEE